MTLTSDQDRILREECGLPAFAIRTARAQNKLQAVRKAAVAEFRRQGFLGGSVDEIARRSGVSKPTIYTYVDSKERLFLDAIGDALISAYTGLSGVESWTDAESARAVLRHFLLDWAQRLLEPVTIDLRRTVIGEAERFPQLAELWARTNAIYGDRPLAEALADMARARLLLLPDGDLPLRQLIAMGIGSPQLIATFRPKDFDRSELPDIATGAVSVFWGHYGKDAR